MTPYLLLLFFVTALGLLLCEWKKSRRNDIIFLCLVSVAMIVLSALRAESVGVDYAPYLEYFQRVREGGWSYLTSAQNTFRWEPGFGLLNYVISLVSGSQLFFAAAMGVVMVGLTALLAYRCSSSTWMSIFVFVSFGFFSYTLCTLRQQLAACIMLFAIPYLQKKKLLPYLIIIVIAALFHKSLWLMIPVYFVAWLPINWKTLSLYGAGTIFLLIFERPILDFITQFVYKSYTADNYYRALGRDFQTAFIPIVLFVVAVLLKKRLLQRNPQNLPMINLSAYACIFFILTLKTFIFQRIALIFLPIAVLLIPEMLNCMAPDPEKVQELEGLRRSEAGKKKQASQRYVQLKIQVRDERAMYYGTIGFILFGGFLYNLFLLAANRLLLVPYVTMFH